MKCTSETRAVLRMKKHIDNISKETGPISILAKKSVAEEVMDTMVIRKELSEKGYSILKRHMSRKVDSKLDAVSRETACAAEAAMV